MCVHFHLHSFDILVILYVFYTDCGAGIGRVSKNFLLHRAAHVDLVEQSPRLLNASAGYIGSDSARTTCICSNLQVGVFLWII